MIASLLIPEQLLSNKKPEADVKEAENGQINGEEAKVEEDKQGEENVGSALMEPAEKEEPID